MLHGAHLHDLLPTSPLRTEPTPGCVSGFT